MRSDHKTKRHWRRLDLAGVSAPGEGTWLAVKDGRVIASAKTAQVLGEMLATLKGRTDGVVMRYVRSSSEEPIVSTADC